jgi:hypothetical protein
MKLATDIVGEGRSPDENIPCASTSISVTQWWTNECVCLQCVAQTRFAGPPKFEPAKPELMACAYELVAIDFERRAWVSTVMSGKPIEAYLGSWLPDGFY